MVNLCGIFFNNSRQSSLFGGVLASQSNTAISRSLHELLWYPYVGYSKAKRREKALMKMGNRQEMSKNSTDAMKWHLALCGLRIF
jgi:mRNA deadenylase 3'-5' endonuclease subunit Ccr4